MRTDRHVITGYREEMLVAREAQVYRQIQENKSLFASGDMGKEKVFGLGLKECAKFDVHMPGGWSMKRKPRGGMKHKPQAQVQRQCLVCFPCLFVFGEEHSDFIFVAQGHLSKKILKGGLGEGWENNGIESWIRCGAQGQREVIPERKKQGRY